MRSNWFYIDWFYIDLWIVYILRNKIICMFDIFFGFLNINVLCIVRIICIFVWGGYMW